jgi:hypothetical protein
LNLSNAYENGNLYMKKNTLALAITVVAGLGTSVANAATVTSMTLADTITNQHNNIAADDGPGSDGRDGAFSFDPIYTGATGDYSGAFLFTSNGGTIDMTSAGAPLAWTDGISVAGILFQPYHTGPIVADITGGVLTVSSLPFASYSVGDDILFNMNPDSAPTVLNLIQTGADTYAYRIAFSHYITNVEDPSGAFVNYTGYWILEGTMSTAVPIPAAAWLMGSGLLGLAGVARRRRSV